MKFYHVGSGDLSNTIIDLGWMEDAGINIQEKSKKPNTGLAYHDHIFHFLTEVPGL